MSQNKIVELNGFRLAADRAASSFYHEEERQIERYSRRSRHLTKYASLFDRQSRYKVALVLIPFAHLAAVLWEGYIIQPLCDMWLADISSYPTLQLIASWMPVVVLFGASLMIGHNFHLMSYKPHRLIPGRFRLQGWKYGLVALVMAAGYLYFLLLMQNIGDEIAKKPLLINEVIPVLGVIELVFGVFAILGWEIIWIYTAMLLLNTLIRRGEKRMENLARQCAVNQQFYEQSLEQLSPRERTLFGEHPLQTNVETVARYYYDHYSRKSA